LGVNLKGRALDNRLRKTLLLDVGVRLEEVVVSAVVLLHASVSATRPTVGQVGVWFASKLDTQS
jgi:hypothetical protein